MGIKNLTKFIKEKCKDAHITTNINAFAFTKIAIDTPMYMFKFKSINAAKMDEPWFNPDGWLWSFIHFVYSLRKHDIHPVFILEGGYPPEKSKTRESRKKDREDIKKKTMSLEQSICSFTEKAEGEPPSDLQEEWNKIARKKNLPYDSFDLESVKEQVRQRHRYDMTIRSRDYDKLKILLKIMNVPYIHAPMEAEALCAYLWKEGIVEGIASNDSDIFAYGCNLIVDFIFSNNEEESKVSYIDYSVLLELLALNEREFLDFCIMCGTDYNDNIYRIGTVKSYDLIKTYKNIEEVDKFLDPTGTKGTTLILNYKRVREIFNTYGLAGSDKTMNAMELLKKKAVWSDVPDFYLLCMFGMKINLTIDFDWIKEGFEKCSVKWDNDSDLKTRSNEDNDYFPVF